MEDNSAEAALLGQRTLARDGSLESSEGLDSGQNRSPSHGHGPREDDCDRELGVGEVVGVSHGCDAIGAVRALSARCASSFPSLPSPSRYSFRASSLDPLPSNHPPARSLLLAVVPSPFPPPPSRLPHASRPPLLAVCLRLPPTRGRRGRGGCVTRVRRRLARGPLTTGPVRVECLGSARRQRSLRPARDGLLGRNGRWVG